jgi:hypothetical protein
MTAKDQPRTLASQEEEELEAQRIAWTLFTFRLQALTHCLQDGRYYAWR